MMRYDFSGQLPRALVFSLVAELTFVILFVVNYFELIVSSITSLDSVPLFATIADRIGMNVGSANLQVLQPVSTIFSNAFTTAFIWSLLNALILISFGISQYRN